jgi:hypothetical protein
MKRTLCALAAGTLIAAAAPYAASAGPNGIDALMLHELNTKRPATAWQASGHTELNTGAIARARGQDQEGARHRPHAHH